MALRYFRTYLEGRRFRLFTDNQALTYILNLSHPKGRLARWVSELQQFAFDIAHRPGDTLPDADAMSRLHITAPRDDHHVSALLWDGTEAMSLKDGRLQVPKTSVPKILALYHDSPHSGGHDGFWRTYWKIKQRFHWNTMKQDISEYVRTCHQCQICKAKFKPRGSAMIIAEHSKEPFATIHLDFAELRKKAREEAARKRSYWQLMSARGWSRVKPERKMQGASSLS